MKLVLRDSAYVCPFLGILDNIFEAAPYLPVTISVAGGVVGEFALVTQSPTGTPLILLPPFFLRIIFKCVGLVILRKY